MIPMLTLLRLDLQQIFRDKTLLLFLFAPLLLLGVLRYVVPAWQSSFPALQPYGYIFVMFAGVQTAIMLGFVVSFILLEEKDEGVLQALRVLPIAPAAFVRYRLAFATLFSAAAALLLLLANGLVHLSLPAALLLAVQYSLVAPLIVLLVGTFAQNKIEGMAFFKGVDLLLLLPILSFFLPGWYGYLFAWVPTYWTFQFFLRSYQQVEGTIWFLMGLGMYGAVLYGLFGQFKRRVLG